MKLRYVTITGADNDTDPQDMVRLSKAYPLTEWGILFSTARWGSARYPSKEKVGEFFRMFAMNKMSFSLHLCGDITRHMMMGDFLSAWSIIDTAAFSGAKFRVQINFNASRNPYDTDKLVVWMLQTRQTLKQHRDVDIQFIFQENKSNRKLVDEILNNKLMDYDFLFDASGGRGSEIKTLETPIAEHHTGYAGGLGPQNLGLILSDLNSFLRKDERIWIDTETAVRTSGKLDMVKVEKFLETAHETVGETT